MTLGAHEQYDLEAVIEWALSKGRRRIAAWVRGILNDATSNSRCDEPPTLPAAPPPILTQTMSPECNPRAGVWARRPLCFTRADAQSLG